MRALPDDAVAYKRTSEFTEESVPAGLRKSHRTREQVWGRICVLEGLLRYRILEPALEQHLLRPGSDGIVEPGVRHEVEPEGAVRFFVEFLRAKGADSALGPGT